MVESMNTWLFEVKEIANELLSKRVRTVFTPFQDVATVFEGREFLHGGLTSKFVVTQNDGGGYLISIENNYNPTGYEF